VLIAANVCLHRTEQNTATVVIHSGTTGGDRLADGSFEGISVVGPMVAAASGGGS